MGDDDSGDKTEEPTPHKLREARKKGQIAKSKEMTSAIMVFVSFYTLKANAEQLWVNMEVITRESFKYIPLQFTPEI
ncbi:hypothetical protein EBR96_08530, partial [bacterium]|nr:hypothetical protein [bacterium]